MNVTTAYFHYILKTQAELPRLIGFDTPDPEVSKVYSAGWTNVRGDPDNKTMYLSRKPETVEKVAPHTGPQFKANVDPFQNKAYFGFKKV